MTFDVYYHNRAITCVFLIFSLQNGKCVRVCVTWLNSHTLSFFFFFFVSPHFYSLIEQILCFVWLSSLVPLALPQQSSCPTDSFTRHLCLTILPRWSSSSSSASSPSSSSLSWIRIIILHSYQKAALLVASSLTHTHTHTYTSTVADHHWLSSKIPCTIKGKDLSVSHVGDYGTEWQGTGDTKRPGWMHLRQAWQVLVTPGAGLHSSHTGISLASCHLSTTLLSLTLTATCTGGEEQAHTAEGAGGASLCGHEQIHMLLMNPGLQALSYMRKSPELFKCRGKSQQETIITTKF